MLLSGEPNSVEIILYQAPLLEALGDVPGGPVDKTPQLLDLCPRTHTTREARAAATKCLHSQNKI